MKSIILKSANCLQNIQCPSCGASIQPQDKNIATVFCKYCEITYTIIFDNKTSDSFCENDEQKILKQITQSADSLNNSISWSKKMVAACIFLMITSIIFIGFSLLNVKNISETEKIDLKEILAKKEALVTGDKRLQKDFKGPKPEYFSFPAGPNHPMMASFQKVSQAYAFVTQKKFPEAEKIFLEILEAAKRFLPESHPDTGLALRNLGNLYRDMGDLQKSISFLKESVSCYEKFYGDTHYDVAVSLNDLLSSYNIVGKHDEDEAILKRIVKIDENFFGPNHFEAVNAKKRLLALQKK